MNIINFLYRETKMVQCLLMFYIYSRCNTTKETTIFWFLLVCMIRKLLNIFSLYVFDIREF
jgi:hypothetical protein